MTAELSKIQQNKLLISTLLSLKLVLPSTVHTMSKEFKNGGSFHFMELFENFNILKTEFFLQLKSKMTSDCCF